MSKEELRERVWSELEESGEARFPFPPHGRIPNFAGADEAAELLSGTDEWMSADSVKCNPDSPQRSVRMKALTHGKVVFVAVPRMREEKCFLRLDPDELDDFERATTIKGSSELGVPVAPEDIGDIDLVVSGSVAVNLVGARVGKGEGYSDLEYAVLREYGVVDDVPVATTVHELQVVDDVIEVEPHDVPLDLIVSPERVVYTDTGFRKPDGVEWGLVTDKMMGEIPVLQRLLGDMYEEE